MLELQRATTHDTRVLAELLEAVWPDDTPDTEEIARAISSPAHIVLLALIDRVHVGFVSGFVTLALDGTRRWEVDLLGVTEEARGEGVGTQLIMESIVGGREAGAILARALVRVGNGLSERAFQHCGFEREANVLRLFTASGMPGFADSCDEKALHSVVVQTLKYHGVWLENVRVEHFGRLNQLPTIDGATGVLINGQDQALQKAAIEAGFEEAGHFYWWVRTLTAGVARVQR